MYSEHQQGNEQQTVGQKCRKHRKDDKEQDGFSLLLLSLTTPVSGQIKDTGPAQVRGLGSLRLGVCPAP